MARLYDKFPEKVVREIALMACCRCAFPSCSAVTSIPKINLSGPTVLGEAGHISAGSKHGPRFDHTMSSQDRKSAKNGIWLCRPHHKIVDSDIATFTCSTLKAWRTIVFEEINRQAQKSGLIPSPNELAILEVGAVKNKYELYSLITKQRYGYGFTTALRSMIKDADSPRAILDMAAELSCELWKTEPDVAGILTTVVGVTPDLWTPNAAVFNKLHDLCMTEVATENCEYIGLIDPASYALAGKGNDVAHRAYIRSIVYSNPMGSADAHRSKLYYGSDADQISACVRHSMDPVRKGLGRAEDIARLIEMLRKTGVSGPAQARKELIRLIKKCQQALKDSGEEKMAVFLNEIVAPFAVGVI